MDINVQVEDTQFTVITQAFSLTLLDTPANRKTAVVMLRAMTDAAGVRLFTLPALAPIVGSANRQASSQHVEDFRACGQDMKATLLRDCKVDEQVLEAAREELLACPLISTEALCERVNARLARTDLSAANMDAALEQISCRELRRVLRGKLSAGTAHYKESYLLESMFSFLEHGQEVLPGIEGPEVMAPPCVSDPTAIRTLLKPGGPMADVPPALRWIGVLMSLYYWGVPLSRLGQWSGVHKTTILRWLMGLVRCLYPSVQGWLALPEHACVVLVDEKWLKLKGVWHYWFVAIDERTGLPLLSYLAKRRSAKVCRYIGVRLKKLGISIKAVVTDGLAGYAHLLPEVVHQVCIFHHQQGVFRYVREHLGKSKQACACQKEMLKVVKTSDKRTVRRRLEKLAQKAEGLGIGFWIEAVRRSLPQLLPAIGSRRLPRTTNGIERFFRAFNRFYKTRGGFHSVYSARWELLLFILVYLFTQQDKDGKAPIDAIVPEACAMPFYRLINDPFSVLLGVDHVKLPQKMADDELALALAA